MKKVKDLNLGSNDAEDYKRRENKQFFNQVFLRDEKLDKLLQPNIFFLMGEKGTGKTAYAVYLSNNEYKDTKSVLRYVRETEYNKFIQLKNTKNLQLSDYKNIWSVILLILIAKQIDDFALNESPFSKSKKIKAIRKAIDEYYAYAFSPEISSVISIADETKLAAETIFKFLNAENSSTHSVTFQEERFQINLQYIEKRLQEGLSDLKLKSNYYIFIDGIDFRPHNIPYEEYLNCVKGLANAVWELNNDYFSQIKDSKGRFKVIMLLRPDIFSSIGFQNAANKIINNTVYLDWRTEYKNFLESDLMKIPGKLLASQQEGKMSELVAFNSYFNWKSKPSSPQRDFDPAYIDLLQISLSRPRDLLTCMILLKNLMNQKNIDKESFSCEVFHSDEFKNAYSEYFLSNIKDQLSFYYTDEDWDLFLQFFSLFNGKTDFSWEEYEEKYNQFIDIIFTKAHDLPEFIDTPEMFLQFLYDANIISWIEDVNGSSFFRWCYRERNSSNISPKVKTHVRYRFHNSLHKRLNMGH